MRRPGGAVCPAMKPTTGFFILALYVLGRGFFGIAANFANHHYGFGLRIAIEQLQRVQEVGADDGIAADPDRGRLPDAARRELIHGFVGQRARARDDSDRPFFMDMGRHDADLAFARRNDARTIGTDQARAAVLQEFPGAHHVRASECLR